MKQSGFGIASLILGIVGMLLSCIAIGIVPCIIGLIFAIVALTQNGRKHGVAIGGLVCSVIGIGIFLLCLFVTRLSDDESSTVSSNNNTAIESGRVDGEEEKIDLASQMEVTEYSYENTIGDTLYFLVVKNNSDETVEISVNATAKDADGNTIGASDASGNAIGSGEEVCLCVYFDGVKNANSFDYTMTVKKDTYYDSVVSDLTIEQSTTNEKVILTCTNNGEKAAEFVEAYALFFNNGELTGYDSTYITDDDCEIKPGATLSSELNCYGGYDDVKIYISGRR